MGAWMDLNLRLRFAGEPFWLIVLRERIFLDQIHLRRSRIQERYSCGDYLLEWLYRHTLPVDVGQVVDSQS